MKDLRMIILLILCLLMWISIGTDIWILILILWIIQAIIVYVKDTKD